MSKMCSHACRRVEGERWRQAAGKLVRSVPNLNRSQKEAVAKAIFRRVTLWQVIPHHPLLNPQSLPYHFVPWPSLQPQSAATLIERSSNGQQR